MSDQFVAPPVGPLSSDAITASPIARRCLTSVCLPSNLLEGGIEVLASLPVLEDVDLRNNQLTDAGADEILIRRQHAIIRLGKRVHTCTNPTSRLRDPTPPRHGR